MSSPPKKKRRRMLKVNSTHKAKTDCPVVGCKVIQKRMDHLKKHYVSMVVWEGDNPVSSGSAEYKRASKEARDHTDHASSKHIKKHSIPPFKIVNKQPTLLDRMLTEARPTRRPGSDEGEEGAGEAPSLNSRPSPSLSASLAPEEVPVNSLTVTASSDLDILSPESPVTPPLEYHSFEVGRTHQGK